MKKLFLVTALCLLVMPNNALAAKQTVTSTDTGAQSRTKLNANFTELYDGKSDKTAVVRYWSDWPTTEPNNVLAVNTIVAYNGALYKVIQQVTKTGSTADPATLTAYFAEVGAGDNLGTATASDVSALYTGVSGYLFSDGTKKSPSAADIGLGTSDNPSFNSVHASGGNLAAANKQVTKAWQSGLSYTADVTSVIHGGKHWIAKTTHTAGSTTEPGVGASYTDAWTEVSGSFDEAGDYTPIGEWNFSGATVIGLSGGSMIYPGAGVPNSTGSAWGTSYTVGTAANNLVQLNASAQLPAVSAALLTNFPTLNQNTTGTAAGLSGTPNITVGTISAGAAGFSVDADGDVIAKSVTVTRTTSPTSVRFYEGTGGGDNYIDLTLSGNLSGDSTVNLDALITTAAFDDTPDNGSTTTAPTANWAYDHENDTTTHGVSSGAILGGALGSTDNQLLRSDGTGGATAQGTGITVDDSNNVTIPGNISSNGLVTGLMPSKVLTSVSGTHDGSSNVATLSDSGESFTTSAYVGMTLYNITDGSSCTVTANNATTMTCTLAGGTDNDWDASDAWQVGPGPYQSGSWFYVTNAGTIRHPSTAGYQVCYESDAAAVLTVDMASGSMIFQGVLDSAVTALDAGDSIDSSGSTTGDFQCIHNKSTTEAQGKGKRGTWIDGGAS